MVYKLKPQFEFENYYCCALSLWSQSWGGTGWVFNGHVDNQEKKICLKPQISGIPTFPHYELQSAISSLILLVDVFHIPVHVPTSRNQADMFHLS